MLLSNPALITGSQWGAQKLMHSKQESCCYLHQGIISPRPSFVDYRWWEISFHLLASGARGACPSLAMGLAGLSLWRREGSQQKIIRDYTLGRTGDAQRYSKNKYSKEHRDCLESDDHRTWACSFESPRERSRRNGQESEGGSRFGYSVRDALVTVTITATGAEQSFWGDFNCYSLVPLRYIRVPSGLNPCGLVSFIDRKSFNRTSRSPDIQYRTWCLFIVEQTG